MHLRKMVYETGSQGLHTPKQEGERLVQEVQELKQVVGMHLPGGIIGITSLRIGSAWFASAHNMVA
jgi:hypothetical protein